MSSKTRRLIELSSHGKKELAVAANALIDIAGTINFSSRR